MKKWKANWKKILIVLILILLLVFGILMYGKVSELTNQLAYLQDTTNIILSDVGGMQSSIEKTLEEEASMVEDYSIEVKDMDFARHEYKVEVSVIPKEYTDNTTMSIYFGTTECPLKADGYMFKGNITLPLNKTFNGNVTFLLANGKKKTTEVVEDFDGVSGKFDQVLSGTLDGTPALKDGKLSLKGKCTYTLDNVAMYHFKSFEIAASLDGEEIWTQDLMQNLLEEKQESSKDDKDLVTTEQAVEENSEGSTVDSGSGTVTCRMVYEKPQQQKEDVEQTQAQEGQTPSRKPLRIYLRAVTTEGYRFETDLLREDAMEEENKWSLDKESIDTKMYRSVYDRKDQELTIDWEKRSTVSYDCTSFFAEWQGKDELCSHSFGADDVDMFIVCLNNFFYNSKSQAGSPFIFSPGKIRFIKAVPDFFDTFCRNSDSGIFHGNKNFFIFDACFNLD